MQLPKRKPGKYSAGQSDFFLTKKKFSEITQKLALLKKKQPFAAQEVARLAEMGDFSENAEYQIAKGRLRGINSAILKLEHELNASEIIHATQSNRVSLGHTVTVKKDDETVTYTILGSNETNPGKGIISHHSPIGEALLGHSVGDRISVAIGGRSVILEILSIRA